MEYQDNEHLTIKQWSAEERPREKLMAYGNQALSNSELLAIILGSGTKRQTAVELGRQVLLKFDNSLRKLGSASASDLMNISGIGPATAAKIIACFSIGTRQRREEIGKQTKITSSEVAWEIAQPLISGLKHEEFWIALLNRANILIKTAQISRGGISGTMVDSRLVYSLALESKATSIILYHNHPSGNLTPSSADKALTEKLCKIASLTDIKVLDHIIVGEENYFSFADHGLMPD